MEGKYMVGWKELDIRGERGIWTAMNGKKEVDLKLNSFGIFGSGWRKKKQQVLLYNLKSLRLTNRLLLAEARSEGFRSRPPNHTA